MEVAFGCCHMGWEEFGRSTLRYVMLRVNGYTKQKQQDDRQSWEQTRHLMRAVLTPYAKKGLKLTDVLPLPWDEKPAALTQKDLEELNTLFPATLKE